MADDNRFRSTRPGDSYRRAAEPSRPGEHAGGSDPLAELARLIGKNDPYAEFGLRDSAPEEPRESYSTTPPAQEDWQRPSSHERYRDPYPASDSESARGSGSYGAGREGYRDYPSLPPEHDARLESWRADDAAAAFDQLEALHATPHVATPHHETPLHATSYADDRGHDEQDAHEADHYDDGDAPFDPHADQTYDDPPRALRRGGLAMALAIIGCAMLGTAGAYAYRSFYGAPAATQPPPVITADNSTPTKIIPAPAGDPQSGKVIQDRLANAGKEQIVSKQEEPVAVRDIGTQAAPRVVLPAPVAPAPAGSLQAPAGSGGSGAEPKPSG
jgi:hypothetical protein